MNYQNRVDTIQEVLNYIPPAKSISCTVGSAIKNELGQSGFPMWESWLSNGALYDTRGRRLLWTDAIEPYDGHIDTLFKLAEQHGYVAGDNSSVLKVNESIRLPFGQETYHAKLDDNQLKTYSEDDVSACLSIWLNANSQVDHPYLKNRQIKSYGLAQYNKYVVIPIRKYGIVINLQFIDAEGSITYLSDHTISGGYHTIGKPDSKPILVGVDYTSVASAHEATGFMGIVTMTIENLPSVVKAIRTQFTDNKIIILGDNAIDVAANDSDKLIKIISSVGTKVVTPTGTINSFNDLHCQEGLESVRKQIVDSLLAEPEKVTEVDADADADATITTRLLHDIKSIFNSSDTDRLYSRELVAELNAIDDSPWNAWNKGKPLTQNTLARLLKVNNIQPKKVRVSTSTGQGYYLKQFT